MTPSATLVFIFIWWPLLVFGVPSPDPLPPNNHTKLSVLSPSVNSAPGETSSGHHDEKMISSIYSEKSLTSKAGLQKVATGMVPEVSSPSFLSLTELEDAENSAHVKDAQFHSPHFDEDHLIPTNFGVQAVAPAPHKSLPHLASAGTGGKGEVLRSLIHGGARNSDTSDTLQHSSRRLPLFQPEERNFEALQINQTRPNFDYRISGVGSPVATGTASKEHTAMLDDGRITQLNHPITVQNLDREGKSLEFPIDIQRIDKESEGKSLNTQKIPFRIIDHPPTEIMRDSSFTSSQSLSHKLSWNHNLSKTGAIHSTNMAGHTHKRDIAGGADGFFQQSNFQKRRKGPKSVYSSFSLQKNITSVNNNQSTNGSIGIADSVKMDTLTSNNNSDWDRYILELPNETSFKPHHIANQLQIAPAKESVSTNHIPVLILQIAASGNAQTNNFENEARTLKPVCNETDTSNNISETLNADKSSQETFTRSNKIGLVSKLNLPSIPFSHRIHQSFSARNSEPQTYQIDSSPFSHNAKYGLSVRTFNLPPPPPVYSHPPPDHHSPHRYPSRFGPPVSTPLPSFDTATPTNISAQHGSNTFLLCRIRNLSNQSVSWIRSRDSHIISVDRMTFIADERFHVFHDPETGSWSLQIKFVQARDDGTYECQVSSEPKISHFVHFTVVTPVVRIPGGADIHVQLGETVTLKCVISAALHHPTYVFWYQKGERVGSGNGFGGGRRVTEERISMDTTVATLLIPQASAADAGTYTCAPDALPTASITLHVINGEHPAAMQHGTSVTSCQASRLLLLSLLTLLWLSTSSLLVLDRRSRTLKGITQADALQNRGIPEATQDQPITLMSVSQPGNTQGNPGASNIRRKVCYCQESNWIYFDAEGVEFGSTINTTDSINYCTIVMEIKLGRIDSTKDKRIKIQPYHGNSNEKIDIRSRTCSSQYALNYFIICIKGNTVVQEHEARKLLEIIQPKLEEIRHHPITITLKNFENVNSLGIRNTSYLRLFENKVTSLMLKWHVETLLQL